MDFCGKSRRFADFENTVDRGSAVIFDADSGLCLSYVRILVLNEMWVRDLSSALVGMLMNSSKLFLFSREVHLNSGVRLLLELYCIIVIKHVAFFTFGRSQQWHSHLPVYLWNLTLLFFGCGCGFGFEQKFWWINGFGEKMADLNTPIHPPQLRKG